MLLSMVSSNGTLLHTDRKVCQCGGNFGNLSRMNCKHKLSISAHLLKCCFLSELCAFFAVWIVPPLLFATLMINGHVAIGSLLTSLAFVVRGFGTYL